MLVLLFLGLVLLLTGASWALVPILTGLPWIPARRERIHKALRMAGVQPGERVYDLGAGDGRVLTIAAGDFGARAVGVEIEPVHCALAWVRSVLSGHRGRIQIRWGSFYDTPLGDADVVFLYVRPPQAARLRPSLAMQLRPGSRVVSLSVDLPGWEPRALDTEDLVFLYQMPPDPGDVSTYLARERRGSGG